MATTTHRISTASTANATSYASGAFTPAANELLIAIVHHSATVAGNPTMTDSQSLGFTRIFARPSDNGATIIAFFVANALAAASSMTVTASTGASSTPTGCIIQVVGVSGMTKTGLTAILQSASVDKATNGGNATTPFVTLGASVNTGNPTIAGVTDLVGAAGMTPPTSWTEFDDTGYATPTIGGEYVTRDSGFTGTTITWGSTLAGRWQAGAVELDASGASSSITVVPNGVATGSAAGLPQPFVKDRLIGVASSEAVGLPKMLPFFRAIGAATASAVGLPKLSPLPRLIGVASAEAVGVPLLRLRQTILLIGVASAEAVGRPLVYAGQLPSAIIVALNGVLSGEAVGVPLLALRQTILGIGAASSEALGLPKLLPFFRARSVASGEAEGMPLLKVRVGVVGVASGEAEGLPRLFSTLRLIGVASASQPGVVTVRALMFPVGVVGGEQLGRPRLLHVARLVGAGSGQALGVPRLTSGLHVIGVVTGGAAGSPLLIVGTIQPALPGAPGRVFISDMATFGLTIADLKRFGVKLASVETAGGALGDQATFRLRISDRRSSKPGVDDDL